MWQQGDDMLGPQPAGKWTGRFDPPTTTLSFFEIGRRYRVTTPFTDFDRDTHPEGESWIFLGSNFVPYDDGMSLYVSLDGEREWVIRLQWRAEEQQEVLDQLGQYLELSS
jgi:hypothetical protein